jgi:hypothetical protein
MCPFKFIVIFALVAGGIRRLCRGRPKSDGRSLHRWRVGHQLFSVIDQLLVMTLTRLKAALDAKDWNQAVESFDRATMLLEASAAALKYTGDMPAGVYEAEVVTDMQRYGPNRMSGLNMKDHQAVVAAVRGLQLAKLRAGWPAWVRVAHNGFASALATALQNHVHACTHNAGKRPPISHPDGQIAEDTLTAMNTKRMADGGCPRKPTRMFRISVGDPPSEATEGRP